MNLQDVKNIDVSDVLASLGLQTKKDSVDYVLPAVGLLGIGVLVGAGLALLVSSPKAQGAREELGKKFAQARDAASDAVNQAAAH